MAHRDETGDLVEVFRTRDLAQLAVIKSLLESSGIPFWVQGEEGLHMLPVGGGFFNPEAIGAVLRVRREDSQGVRDLLTSPLPETGPE